MKLKLNLLFNKKHNIDQKGRRQKKESKIIERQEEREGECMVGPYCYIECKPWNMHKPQ